MGGSAITAMRRRCPAWVWTLALLLVGSATRAVSMVVHGHAQGVARHLPFAVGIACLLLGVAALVAGDRLPAVAIHPLLLLSFANTSLLVAAAGDRGDAILNAFAYPWGAVYAAHFMSRRVAGAYAATASAAFGLAIAASGLHRLAGAWVLVTGSVVAAALVTSTLVASLRRQSETDPLTGAANRGGFNRRAADVVVATGRSRRPLTLVLCDVDGLKSVNDSLGHAAGDAALTDVVNAWRSLLRPTDVLARIGGDEFAILLPETDAAAAERVVSRLTHATRVPFSAGIATWRRDDTMDSLLSRADTAMYERKMSRRAVSGATNVASGSSPPFPHHRAPAPHPC